MIMPERNREVAPGARAPVLSSALLARIHELNRDYVELLIAQRSMTDAGGPIESLPAKLLEGLGDLTPGWRRTLAATPFALYSLGFDDAHFWLEALSNAQSQPLAVSVEVRYGASSATAPMQAALCEIVLFLAWHTAAVNRVAARVLFALPDELAGPLIDAPLWRLRQIAMHCPDLMTPRWPANPAFWPDLIRFAASGDSRRLETTQLLGNQLIAVELEGLGPRTVKRLSRNRLRF